MQNYTYHCHTTFSDGKSSAKEMIDKALSLGFTEIGISDHLAIHKNFLESPSWPRFSEYYAPHIYRADFASTLSEFQRHADNIRLIADNYPIKVYVGAEVDYMPYDGWLDEFLEFKEKAGLDYYLTGNHYVFSANGETLFHPRDIPLLFSKKEQADILHNHFNTLVTTIKSGLFDFLGHLDFMRKAEIYTLSDFSDDIKELLKALSERNMPAEINTKGYKKYNDSYPSQPIIQMMKEYNIPVLISDDAHHADDIGKEFARVEENLNMLNYNNRWKLERD